MLLHNEILSGFEASTTDKVMTLFRIAAEGIAAFMDFPSPLAFAKGNLEKKSAH